MQLPTYSYTIPFHTVCTSTGTGRWQAKTRAKCTYTYTYTYTYTGPECQERADYDGQDGSSLHRPHVGGHRRPDACALPVISTSLPFPPAQAVMVTDRPQSGPKTFVFQIRIFDVQL